MIQLLKQLPLILVLLILVLLLLQQPLISLLLFYFYYFYWPAATPYATTTAASTIILYSLFTMLTTALKQHLSVHRGIGVGLFDANRVEGKLATNFDVGDIIHVEYIGDGLMKGSKFTGQVGKYYRSSVKRSKGIVLDQGGELMVEITWRDAPSQFAKSCVGKADKFKVDDFLVDYKVRKIERIAISNNVAVAGY